MSYWHVVAVSQGRRSEWERVFGSARLPVLDGRPRLAEMREGSVMVYDVAVAQLHPGQLTRLAGYIARSRRVGYEEAQAWVRLGRMVVRADGVVVETADAVRSIGRLHYRRELFGGSHAASRWSLLPCS